MREIIILNLVINPRKKLTVTGFTLNVRQSQISGERDCHLKSGNKPQEKTDSNWLHIECTAITDQWRETVVLNLVINPRKKLTVTGFTLNVQQSQISGEREGRIKSGNKPPEKTGFTLNVRQSQISGERRSY